MDSWLRILRASTKGWEGRIMTTVAKANKCHASGDYHTTNIANQMLLGGEISTQKPYHHYKENRRSS